MLGRRSTFFSQEKLALLPRSSPNTAQLIPTPSNLDSCALCAVRIAGAQALSRAHYLHGKLTSWQENAATKMALLFTLGYARHVRTKKNAMIAFRRLGCRAPPIPRPISAVANSNRGPRGSQNKNECGRTSAVPQSL